MDNTLCLVMRTANWRDSDKMLTLFSRDFGLLSALARGAKNLKNPIAAASQPFCCGIFSFTSRGGRLYASQCEIKKEFYGLGADFERYAAACVMIEMTEKILKNTEEYDQLFILLYTCLVHLEGGREHRQVLAYFFVRITDLLGIRPAVRDCAVCGAVIKNPRLFCALEGGAVCDACAPGLMTTPVSPAGWRWIENMLGTAPGAFCEEEGFEGKMLDIMRDYIGILGDLKCRSMRFL